MKHILSMTIIATLLSTTAAVAAETKRPPQIEALIKAEQTEQNACRDGMPGNATTKKHCALWNADRRLETLGWCYGKEGQYHAQMDWHKCGPTSFHKATAAEIEENEKLYQPQEGPRRHGDGLGLDGKPRPVGKLIPIEPTAEMRAAACSYHYDPAYCPKQAATHAKREADDYAAREEAYLQRQRNLAAARARARSVAVPTMISWCERGTASLDPATRHIMAERCGPGGDVWTFIHYEEE